MKKILKLLLPVILLLVGLAGGYFGGQMMSGSDEGTPEKPNPGIQPAIIVKTLQNQTKAWSKGDIDKFMTYYEETEDLRFASGDTVTRGWQTTLDRYKERYPDKAAMGALSFSDFEVEFISKTDALVFGRWTLSREQDAPTGLFSLHMKKFGRDWKIVSDHTSSAPPE